MRTILKQRSWFATVLLASLFIISSCDKDDDGKKYTISGNASGGQVVPPLAVAASGTITGTYDSKSRVLTYTITWTGLGGLPTGAGFYSGPVGVNGSLAASITLSAGAGSSGSITATTTLGNLTGAALISGGLYYTISTAAAPGGEIRGQIAAVEQ